MLTTYARNLLNKIVDNAKPINVGEKEIGVLVDMDDWQNLLRFITKESQAVRRRRTNEFSYTLDEAELGLVGLLCYSSENTPRPHLAPEELRLAGRLPTPVIKAIQGLFNDIRRNSYFRNEHIFDDIKFFNENRTILSYCLDNGAKIVEIAKEHYS